MHSNMSKKHVFQILQELSTKCQGLEISCYLYLYDLLP